MTHRTDTTTPAAPGHLDREVGRRAVLGAACAAGCVALVSGCGGSDSAAAPSTGGASSSAPVAPTTSAASSAAPAGGAALAKLADIPDGGALVTKAKDGSPVVLVRKGSAVTGLSAKCTHRGCTVAPAAGELDCPCHGSRFALDGSVLGGPAAAPLPAYPVTVTDGSVVPA